MARGGATKVKEPVRRPGVSRKGGGRGRGGGAEAPIPATVSPKKRQLTIASRVQNRLRETFPDLSVEEKDVKMVDGLTLRERLLRDLTAYEDGTYTEELSSHDYNNKMRKNVQVYDLG